MVIFLMVKLPRPSAPSALPALGVAGAKDRNLPTPTVLFDGLWAARPGNRSDAATRTVTDESGLTGISSGRGS